MLSRNIMLVFILFSIYFVFGCHKLRGESHVCFKESCFTVTLALSDEEKRRGLQFRQSLSEDEGMFFIFNESQTHSFWMKDTLIPLDILWMDEAYHVVDIIQGAPPCLSSPCPSYRPKRKAQYVLEINAGQVNKFNIQMGDQAELRLKR